MIAMQEEIYRSRRKKEIREEGEKEEKTEKTEIFSPLMRHKHIPAAVTSLCQQPQINTCVIYITSEWN